MTHIVRDVEKPGSKLHKKEVRAAAVHSLSLHAFSPRLALSAALLLLLLGKLCTTRACCCCCRCMLPACTPTRAL